MKLKPLCLAIAVMGLSSSYALAADGTLKFEGTIENSSCQVSGADKTITVKMGNVSTGVFAAGKEGPSVPFDITLTNCNAGTYYLVLEGLNTDNTLLLDTGGAKGVGIDIKDSGGKKLKLTNELVLENGVVEGEEGGQDITFNLSANYHALGTVEAGKANATATFTVVRK